VLLGVALPVPLASLDIRQFHIDVVPRRSGGTIIDAASTAALARKN
jgi:hypothetical protein